MPGDVLVQLGITAGASQGDASRRIEFSTLSRTAISQPSGWDLNGRLRLGYRLPIEALEVMPTAGIDYFYQRRNSLSEVGADSLDLSVAAGDNHTLRSHIGLILAKVVAVGRTGALVPSVQVGWAREISLDDRALTARLRGQPDDFTVYGEDAAADLLTVGAGVTYASGSGFSASLRYGLEYRQGLTQQTLAVVAEYRF
jgi:fibronectin-binding autotransporter adhesin